jgi:site-specific DNA-methyltransferase (adenine-specific)
MRAKVYQGDCLEIIKTIKDETIDLVYSDPPFFTQKVQKLSARTRDKEFSFSDVWKSVDDYGDFLLARLREFKRVLCSTGSLFFHCDHNASHIARLMLDEVFGREMFRSEIIWHYRRWSNSQKNLLPSHQTIFFYSKTDTYKFNRLYEDYSPSTNVDQILQLRKRDDFGKAVYAIDENGNALSCGDKQGVPLSDVWDIPLLNPKAKERTGYPTQKPVLLLEKIIQIATNENDIVLDPFCGSGTTLVAAELLNRKSIGIDVSLSAIEITKARLANPNKTKSRLLEVGRDAYKEADEDALSYLKGLDFIPVQRNNGIDAFLRIGLDKGSIPVRVQRKGEPLIDAACALRKASESKNAVIKILISTESDLGFDVTQVLSDIILIDSTTKAINKELQRFKLRDNGQTNPQSAIRNPQ